MKTILILCGLCAGVWSAGTSVAAEPSAWPMVAAVERQPAAAELRRLMETADTLGRPLGERVTGGLAKLRTASDAEAAATQLQELLDPLCGLAVVLGADAPPLLIPSKQPIELIEQGWATVLVKVVNPDRLRRRLRIESPNARPLPHAPAGRT